ncbi:MAG: Hpt domain-containing protein [Deltaproteobacteria bacterium]|nr:Hpt domain-containing protein [Deltaproteobacteria bacterium]
MELDKYQKIFIQESNKYLDELDAALIKVEKDLQNQQLWGNIHGKVHSVKGMARALSMTDLATFCHAMEFWCKSFQDGTKIPDERIVQLLFDGIDLLKVFVAGKGEISEPEDLERLRSISEDLAKDPEEWVDRAEPEIRPSAAPGKIDRIRVDYALIESLLARSQEIMMLEKTLPPLTQDQISTGLGTWISYYISMLKGLYFQLAQLRLMPVQDFGELFIKTIRDLAKSYNRDVTLEIVGGEIEVDIGLMDRLREPFMHLLRNAVAHGIEPSGEREKSGKAREGKIVLEAERRGDQLVLTVSDDGRGLDREAISAYLKDKMDMRHEEMSTLSNEKLLSIICRPDFSSAGETTQLAGRGIGMNVIARAIEYLGGNMKIQSEPSEGTRFIISLPLSLSIIYAVLFRLGDYILAIPTSLVKSIGNGRVKSSEKVEQFCDLRSLLRMDAKDPGEGYIIILRQSAISGGVLNENEGFAIAADAVIGNMPLMAIPLGELLAKTGFFSGVGIMENGDISLILDLEKIQAAGAAA